MSDLTQLTVDNARKNREALLAIIDGASAANGTPSAKGAPVVSLDITGFEAIDLSGLQLLVAFAREAAARGKDLAFTGTVPECLSRALAVSGLAPSACATADDAVSAIKAAIR